MSVLQWILVGILLYWVGVIALRRLDLLPSSVNTTGPITTIRTQRGRTLLNWLAQFRRFWRAWANIGVGIAIVVMVGSFVMLVFSALVSLVQPSPQEVQQPQNVLVIPGVNEFLPLEVAPEIIVGLIVGLVVHEGGHGLLCRVEHIDIESMGVALLAFIPLGAFVEPDESSTNAASRGARTRMYAAGVTNNFAITIIVFALLFGPVAGALAVAPGAAVGGALPGSAADEAGIGAGDRITAINGTPIEDFNELESTLDATEERTVSVTLNGDERQVTVNRSLLVTASTPDSPADLGQGSLITAIDGEPVWTQPAFDRAIAGQATVEMTFIDPDGEEHTQTVPIGTFATVMEGPLQDAGLAHGTSLVITAIDGEQVTGLNDLQRILGTYSPGESVELAYWKDGSTETIDVTLGDRDGDAVVGVATTRGTTGMMVSDFGIQEYPAKEYLALLGGGDPDDDPIGIADSFIGKMVIAVFLPLASVLAGGVLPFNFPGFTGETTNFFVVEGSLSMLGSGVFLLANLLFWTGWININLGFFNCIPAIPLDGGHILRSCTEAVLSRSPVGRSRTVIGIFVTGVALIMLLSFLVVIFGAGLLGG